MCTQISDGYSTLDVAIFWKGDKSAVHGVENVEIPQFTIVDYKTTTLTEELATGEYACANALHGIMQCLVYRIREKINFNYYK